jgi:hypothetical protein
MFRGRLLAESLRTGVEMTLPGLTLVRISRQDVSDSATPSQPSVRTSLDFELPDDRADELAVLLAHALSPDDGWYADYQSATEHVVVFSGRSFRYGKGDDAARAEAVAFGRAAGTPEHRLDWGG